MTTSLQEFILCDKLIKILPNMSIFCPITVKQKSLLKNDKINQSKVISSTAIGGMRAIKKMRNELSPGSERFLFDPLKSPFCQYLIGEQEII